METSKNTYENKLFVNEYGAHRFLFPAEKYIFNEIGDILKVATVLDIGVGGGRTTHFLLPVVKQYIGVDYAKSMIDVCKSKFNSNKNAHFFEADAISMPFVEDKSCSIVLFSFNGIDYVDIAHRKAILNEVHRILIPGGYFIFSFHNMGNINKLYSFQWPRNPLKYLKEWQRKTKVAELNGPSEQYLNKDWAILKDGGNNFESDTMYISPLFQYNMLVNGGFTNIKYNDTFTCEELANNTTSETPWIYATCRK